MALHSHWMHLQPAQWAVATAETEVGFIRDALLFCDELAGLGHQLVQILHLFAVDTCGALDDECSCRRHTAVV